MAATGYHSKIVVPILQMSRLILRPLELADAQQAQVQFPHWEIVRYLAHVVPWPYLPDGAYTYYRDIALPPMDRGVAWHGSLGLKTDQENDQGKMIGSISLLRGENDNRRFWLGLLWHQQGLMTEGCDAVTDDWFNTLQFPVLRVPKAVANVASRRISEKSAMRLVGQEEGGITSQVACLPKSGKHRRRVECAKSQVIAPSAKPHSKARTLLRNQLLNLLLELLHQHVLSLLFPARANVYLAGLSLFISDNQ